ncbi:MAG TPA: PSD1 and planctomycete cytochrome C domain-containing protein [Pirellulales bacterium]|nr:PSD1 and planctomycete cytochrome C domain-containing protein [Pirellulales bacterium]
MSRDSRTTSLIRRPNVVRLALVAVLAAASGQRAGAVDYVRDVRPILAGKCFACHGADEAARQAGLRLDERDAALATLDSGQRAIVPGKPDESALVARITSADAQFAMPPAETGKKLSPQEVATLRAWIAADAPYARHWAYVKPVRPALPAVRRGNWPRGAIDHFVLARLEAAGLSPSPPADRATWIRRVSLDLIGLPPTADEVQDFVLDSRPEAYDALVDRLLAKPAYGERWASMWLDLARYADSQGYAPDGPRTIWRWRDWVISALNANMPYDRFTIEQLAGDLLPDPSAMQIAATGFHRNTQLNTEGGVNLEEFRHAAVVDRVNTTFAVWMGSTLACAQCHHHKYDPFSQRDYYQVFSIFNNTDDFNTDNPVLEVPRVGQDAEFAQVKADLAAAQTRWDEQTKARDALQAEWESRASQPPAASAGESPAESAPAGQSPAADTTAEKAPTDTAAAAPPPKEIAEILALPADKRDKKQQEKLQAYHRGLSADWKKVDEELAGLKRKFDEVSTTVPIMHEGTPRPSFIYVRGEYQSPGEAVKPGVPAVLHPLAAGAPANRLGLAQWLVDAENPLSARVAVNRLWQELFGAGIVETAEEFGTQGEPPSHPELLDYLAVEYRESGWDTKHMLRLIVTSATYQQSAATSAALVERDPHNRLLARGPRSRLPAEMVRDQALAISGLLSPKMYGPPVQPPQPSVGLSAAFGSSTDWKTSEGEDQHRRAIYTRWRRNLPYPSMVAFDAPERNICAARRMRTNTPLQALVTLNDPVFVECAQAFARRIIREGGSDAQGRAAWALAQAVKRRPTTGEAERLAELYTQSRRELEAAPEKAEALATKPLGPLPDGMNALDAAAWTVVANAVLNLDETLTKP